MTVGVLVQVLLAGAVEAVDGAAVVGAADPRWRSGTGSGRSPAGRGRRRGWRTGSRRRRRCGGCAVSVTVMVVPLLGGGCGQAARTAVPAGAGRDASRSASRSSASLSWICSSTKRSGCGNAASARVRSKVSPQCGVATVVVAGHRLGLGGRVAQAAVDGGREQLRVAEGVGDAVPGDRVAVVAGVADQCPARADRLSHVVGQARPQPRTTEVDPAGTHPRGQRRATRPSSCATARLPRGRCRPRAPRRAPRRVGDSQTQPSPLWVGKTPAKASGATWNSYAGQAGGTGDVHVEGGRVGSWSDSQHLGAEPAGHPRPHAVRADDVPRADARRAARPRPGRRRRRPGRHRRGADPVTVTPVRTWAPADRAASRSSASRTRRRGATSRSTPARSLIGARDLGVVAGRTCTSRTAGAPLASTSSSRPHRDSCTTPPRTRPCVDRVSLGKRDRSTRATSWPARASSIAVAAPAQRAPTTTTSCSLRCGVLMPVDCARGAGESLGDRVEVAWRSPDPGRSPRPSAARSSHLCVHDCRSVPAIGRDC